MDRQLTGRVVATITARKERGLPGVRVIAAWLADHQLYLTGIAAPVLLFRERFPMSLVAVGWAWLLIPWLARLVAQGRLTRRTPADPAVLAILLMLPVGLYASVDLERSLDVVSQILVGLCFFYGLVNARRSEVGLWLPVAGLIAVAIGLALVAPFVVVWNPKFRIFLPQFYRHVSPMVGETLHANIMAAIMGMALFVSASLGWRGEFQFLPGVRLTLVKRGLLALAAVLFLALVFTQSRGAALGLAAGALVLVALYRPKLLLALPPLLMIAYLGLRYVDTEQVLDMVFSSDPLQTWASRQEAWSRAIYMLQDFPYTGIGPGTFPRVAVVMYPFFLASPDNPPTHAHNLFLQVGVDMGIPGLVAFVGLVTACLLMAWRAWRGFRRAGKRDLEGLAVGVLASLALMLAHGLLDAPLWGSKPSVVAWFFMGLAGLVYVRWHESEKETGRGIEGENGKGKTGEG